MSQVNITINGQTVAAEAGMTVLAVSHRAVAFDRADQVLWLDHGRLVAR